MMSIKHYDKRVRDKIPQIIESSGKSCTVCRLDDESYLRKVIAFRKVSVETWRFLLCIFGGEDKMLQINKAYLRKVSPYYAAILCEQYLFYEMRMTAKLVCEG